MIRLPRRSVTRFFIPLIDVLTLLFCIFLLMPLVQASGEGEDDGAGAAAEEGPGREDTRPGEPALDTLRAELEALQKEKIDTLQERLAVRVLEIDEKTGRLVYHDPERTELTGEAEARALVERDRKARGGARRELYYLILYPRSLTSPYPHRDQREQYDRWFRDVAHGWDIPGLPPGRGGAP